MGKQSPAEPHMAQEQTCQKKNGGGISYQPSGRHKVQPVSESGIGPSDMGVPLVPKHQGDACTGSVECGDRMWQSRHRPSGECRRNIEVVQMI